MNQAACCDHCGRLLDVRFDRDSLDCGGTCWGCMRSVELATGYDPSPGREWLSFHPFPIEALEFE